MSDDNLIQNLELKIRKLSLQNKTYEIYISNLEKEFLNLESDYARIKSQNFQYQAKEVDYQNTKIELNNRDQKILDLISQMDNQKLEHEKYKLKKDLDYEKDVNEVKYFNESNVFKFQNSLHVEKLNKCLYKQILDLENVILTFKAEEKRRADEKELDFDKRMKEMKKKMLEYIKNGQKSNEHLSEEQIRLNDKLYVINRNTLLNELDFQSVQLEDLLKQRQHLDSVILKMKSDIEIHKKVEKLLTQKNKKYTEMIKVLSIKVEENEKNKEKINNNENIKKENFQNDNFKKLNFAKFKKFRKTLPDFPKKTKSVSKDSDNSSIENDKVAMQKELIKCLKEIEDYKSKYECYKTKLDIINNKYGNIMDLFEDVLTKIYYDKNMVNIKNIYINLDEFKQCDFDMLNSEQKYSIVILIIKYLMPLININNIPDKMKNFFQNIENVSLINDRSDKTISVLSTSSYGSFGNGRKCNILKNRIRSSSSEFGKTQIIVDGKYQKMVNSLNHGQKKNKNKNYIDFLNSQNKDGNSFGRTGVNYRCNYMLKNFFNSIQDNDNSNSKMHKTYSLFNM